MFPLIANANFFVGVSIASAMNACVCMCMYKHTLVYKHYPCPCLLLLMKPYKIRETSVNNIVVLVRFMFAVL